MPADKILQNFLLQKHEGIDEFFQDLEKIQTCKSANSSSTKHTYHQLLNTLEDVENIIENQQDIEISIHGESYDVFKVRLIDDYDRKHFILAKRNENNMFIIQDTSLPPSQFDQGSFVSLTEVIKGFRAFVMSLEVYFAELNRIDRCCWVVDPVSPSFKDGYRRIVIEDRIWLHIEISLKGGIQTLKLLGSGSKVDQKSQILQNRLGDWDSDDDILDNIMSALEIEEFPQKPLKLSSCYTDASHECGICMSETGDDGVALPLCPNSKCSTHFHNQCLYQWLIQCNGGLASKTGFVSGECPNCSTPIDNIREKN